MTRSGSACLMRVGDGVEVRGVRARRSRRRRSRPRARPAAPRRGRRPAWCWGRRAAPGRGSAGRSSSGSDSIRSMNRSGSFCVVAGCAKNRYLKPRSKISSAPPDGCDVDHLVALGDRGDRDVEVGGEGAEEQVDLVLGDQPRVVGDRGLLVEAVVEHLQLDLAPEQPAGFVELVDPVLVALHAGLGAVGDRAAERQRHADHDRARPSTRSRARPRSTARRPR